MDRSNCGSCTCATLEQKRIAQHSSFWIPSYDYSNSTWNIFNQQTWLCGLVIVFLLFYCPAHLVSRWFVRAKNDRIFSIDRFSCMMFEGGRPVSLIYISLCEEIQRNAPVHGFNSSYLSSDASELTFDFSGNIFLKPNFALKVCFTDLFRNTKISCTILTVRCHSRGILH